jgi:hypothetical protein
MKECRFCCFSRKIYYHFPIQKNMDKFFILYGNDPFAIKLTETSIPAKHIGETAKKGPSAEKQVSADGFYWSS